MENIEKNLLASFQAEIAQFKKDEEEGRKPTVHLAGQKFSPTDLTERDQEIWEKIKNESITMDEFIKYREEVTKDGNKSRLVFVAMAANKATPVINKKYID